MKIKGLMESIPTNLHDLGYPCPIFLLTDTTIIPRDLTINAWNFAPRFILQMYFAFFNVDCIHGFNSTFLAICSDTSYPVGFPSRIKILPLDVLSFIVVKFRNQERKVVFILVNEDGWLSRYSGFMKTIRNINIIVQTTGGD